MDREGDAMWYVHRTTTKVEGRHQRRRRRNPELLQDCCRLRQAERILRLELLEDRSLLSVDCFPQSPPRREFVNGETSVSVAVAPASVLEDGTTNLVYTFTRSGSTTDALTLNFDVSGGALFISDYTQSGAATFTFSSGTVNFAAGSETAVVTVDPKADSMVELDETVVLTIASGTGYTVGTPSAATGTIANDDASVRVGITTIFVLEDGTTNLYYTFTRDGYAGSALAVNFGVSGSATYMSDYNQFGAATFSLTSGKVNFAAGSSTAVVTIDPMVDSMVELDETVVLTIASGTGYTVGTPSTATGTIANDDASVTVSVAPSFVLEDGTTNLTYTFARTGYTTGSLAVNFAVSGSASVEDYTPSGAAAFNYSNGTVNFTAGSGTAVVTIDPMADSTVEADETVTLTITSGTSYTAGTPSTATGTIANDDASVRVDVAPTSVVEDGSTNLVYTFTRAGVVSGALTLNFAVSGDATFDVDYTQTGAATFSATTGTVIFAADSSTAVVALDPSVDGTVELDETVTLTITSGTGYGVGTPSSATGTISNDDPMVIRQIVSDTAASYAAAAGHVVSFDVRYTTSTGDDTLTGIRLRLHYDSSKLTYQEPANVLGYARTSEPYTSDDTDNADGDDSTDKCVILAWTDSGGQWPGSLFPLPTLLYTANFTLAAGLADGVQTAVRFTAASTADGYDFESRPITVRVANGNLDADGNGTADALTDGILILRYLFAPSGAWNVADAVGVAATRTARPDIKSFLDGGQASVLDADGNGTADALTDGILILRYLFAPTGAWAYSDAVGVGSTRTTREEIRSYLDQYGSGRAPAGLVEMPVTQSAAISTAAAEAGVISVEPLIADRSDESLAASAAPPIRLAHAESDPLGPRDYDGAQSAVAATSPFQHVGPLAPDSCPTRGEGDKETASSPEVSDIIFREWSPDTTRMETPSPWVMPGRDEDDAEAVKNVYGMDGLDWLLMKLG
jgi:hypothetical protein